MNIHSISSHTTKIPFFLLQKFFFRPIKKYFKITSLFLLLLFAACSDKSCIEANDFGEFETEYLTVAAGSDLTCSFGIREPQEGGSDNKDLYYTPSAEFKTMPASRNFDQFIEIISAEYENFLLNDEGINAISKERYENFFTIFDGEIVRHQTNNQIITNYIIGNNRNDQSIYPIYQRDRVVVNSSGNIITYSDDSLKVNHRNMVRFLNGDDVVDDCNGDKSCLYIPDIIDKYRWTSNNSNKGCVMYQFDGDKEREDRQNTDYGDNNKILNITSTDNKRNLKIKYPPLEIFLQCINEAIVACNRKKIENHTKKSLSADSNDKISRSKWEKTTKYTPDVNDLLRITPKSDIFIKARGEIFLGNSDSSLSYFFVPAYLSDTSKNTSLKLQPKQPNQTFVHNDQPLDFSVKAKWSSNGERYDTDHSNYDSLDEGRDKLKESYNALSRLALYIDDKDSISDDDKKIIFPNSITEHILAPKPKSVNQFSYVEYIVDSSFANITVTFNNTNKRPSGLVDTSEEHAFIITSKNLKNLIKEEVIRMYINGEKVCLSDNCANITYDNNKATIEDIFVRDGDVLRVEILKQSNNVGGQETYELLQFPFHDIEMQEDNTKLIDLIEVKIQKSYFSSPISISGLYEATKCHSQQFKIINNTDIYDDMIEKSPSGSEFYLRKGQIVYSPPCLPEPSEDTLYLNLKHKRPAFLCKKRDHDFNINNPSCSGLSKAYCVSRPHSDCTSCDIAIGSQSNNEALIRLINSCKESVTYNSATPYPSPGAGCNNMVETSCRSKNPTSSPDTSYDSCINNCNTCISNTFGSDSILETVVNYDNNQIDICYDLENYIGKVDDIVGQKASDLGKGARELSFNGYYGNFVRSNLNNGELILLEDKRDTNKYRNTLNLLKSGKIKFLVVNNNNLNLEDNMVLFSDSLLVNFDEIGDDGNGYLVELSLGNKAYSNGEMMEAYLCRSKDNDMACHKLEQNNFSNDIDNRKIIPISALEYNATNNKYRNKCKESMSDNIHSNFGYYFNEYGRLEEMNTKTSDHCSSSDLTPNSSAAARKYYSNSENQIEDDKEYQIYLSIIDDQKNNCTILDDTILDDVKKASDTCSSNIYYDGSAGMCNGVRMQNPYYISKKKCDGENNRLILNPYFNDPKTDSENLCKFNCLLKNDNKNINKNTCDGITVDIGKISNTQYLCSKTCSNPTNPAPDSNDFCQDYDISQCKDKKYYCANKLLDNSGSYDVEVKVKDSSKFSGLVFGMLSPITDFIYGSPEECREGKKLFTQERELIGVCKEINHGKSSVSIAGVNIRDLRKKEYVILNNNNRSLIQKYQQSLGKYACKNNGGRPVDDKEDCRNNIANIINTIGYNFANIVDQSISIHPIKIREGNIYEYGERVLHPEHGYIIRKDSMAKRVYQHIINNSLYKTLFKTLMVLSIMFYGGSYLMGMSEFSRAQIMTRVIKLSILMLFLTPGGWFWFQNIFVSFFEYGANYLTLLMISTFESDQVIQTASGGKYFDPALLFSSIDKMIGLLSPVVLYKVTALFFSSIFGYFYVLIIFYATMTYFQVAFKVVLLYLSAKLFINFTFILAPILLLFLLFEQTKDTFNKWLKQLASFSMQQVIILFSFTLFNSILYFLIKTILAYKICWGTVIQSDIVVKISLLKWWTVAGDITNPTSSAAPSILSIAMLLFMVKIMLEFVNNASQFAERMVDGLTSDSMAGIIESNLRLSFANISKTINFAKNKTGADKYIGKHGMVDRAKGVLFNAGLEVEEKNAKAVKLEKETNALRNKLKQAGKKSAQEHKINSIARGKLFAEEGKVLEKINKLNDVREKSMLKVLADHYKNKGISKSNAKLEEELKLLKDPSYKKASWSHDSAASLLSSKGYSLLSSLPKGRSADIKDAKITGKDVKKAYDKLNKVQSTPDINKEKIDEIKSKLSGAAKEAAKTADKKFRYSSSDRFVANFDKRMESKKEYIDKKDQIRKKNPDSLRGDKEEMTHYLKSLASRKKSEILDYKDNNLILGAWGKSSKVMKSYLSSISRVEQLNRIRDGRKNISPEGTLSRFGNSKKSDARLEAENYLIKKGVITPEKLYDTRSEFNKDKKVKKYYEEQSSKKSTKGSNSAFKTSVETFSGGKKLLAIGSLATSAFKGAFKVVFAAKKGVESKSSQILTETGFRNEFNKDEKGKIDDLVDKIESRGGVESLNRMVKEAVSLGQDDAMKKMYPENNSKSLDPAAFEKVVKEFLLAEINERDWRDDKLFNNELPTGPNTVNPVISSDDGDSTKNF